MSKATNQKSDKKTDGDKNYLQQSGREVRTDGGDVQIIDAEPPWMDDYPQEFKE